MKEDISKRGCRELAGKLFELEYFTNKMLEKIEATDIFLCGVFIVP